MAHKGRPWESVFRREFNLNVQTYNFGLAKSYDIHFNPFIGSQPNDLNNATFHPTERPVLLGRKLPHRHDNLHAGTSIFDLELSLTITGVPAGADRILTVTKHGLGIIYQARYGIVHDPFSNWLTTHPTLLVFNLAFFGTKGFDQFPVFQPTPYPP